MQSKRSALNSVTLLIQTNFSVFKMGTLLQSNKDETMKLSEFCVVDQALRSVQTKTIIHRSD